MDFFHLISNEEDLCPVDTYVRLSFYLFIFIFLSKQKSIVVEMNKWSVWMG